MLSITIVLYVFFGNINIINRRPLLFGLATVSRVITSLTTPILFLYRYKGFHVIIYLDGILVLVCSKYAGKRVQTFLCSQLAHLGLVIFPSPNFISLSAFHYLECCDTVNMPTCLCHLWSFLRHSSVLILHNVLQCISWCPLWARSFCVAMENAQLCQLCHTIGVAY